MTFPSLRLAICVAGLMSTMSGPPSAQSRENCPPEALPPRAGSPGRALWLWDSRPLFDSAEARRRLIDLCRCEHIDTIWMQIAVRTGDGSASLQRADAWPIVLRDLHAAGLRVEALDGNPTYALRRFHPIALATIDAVLAYNAGAPTDGRFDGFHYDIEPYSLYRWRFPEHRERMVSEFLEVVLEAERRIRTQPGLRFGVAVPFWWHRPDETTGEPFTAVTLGRVRKPATFHLIDRLDYVAVMSYRNRADGPNGLIAITKDLLEYADAAGRARLYLGAETAGGSALVWFVTGLPREAALARMRASGEDPDVLDPIDDLTRTLFDDGTRLHMGIRIPAGESPESPAVVAALRTIAARYGAPADEASIEATERGTAAAIAVLRKDGEWRDVLARPVPVEDGRPRSGFLGTSVTPRTITFAGAPLRDLREQLSAAQESFVRHRSFAGLAIHDYKHITELLKR